MGAAEWQLGTAETVTWPRGHKLPRTLPTGWTPDKPPRGSEEAVLSQTPCASQAAATLVSEGLGTSPLRKHVGDSLAPRDTRGTGRQGPSAFPSVNMASPRREPAGCAKQSATNVFSLEGIRNNFSIV